MPQTKGEAENSLVLSYLSLRTSIGVIGMLLPFVLAIGKVLLESPGLLPSISHYYYSIMGNVFVGSLFANGVFLWSYKGYDWRDSLAATIASLSVIGVALFPTTPAAATASQIIIGRVHFFFAAVFFLTLAYFALVLFRKTDPRLPPTRMKHVRNGVYLACGMLIVLSITAIAALQLWVSKDAPIFQLSPVLWLESIASVSFGISWFVKGEAILRDR